ncbi:MAG: gamma-glutamyl-gamma-aminobutyrate hydrolase family protein [Clostridia bacterium]|nr:gamma-glutamyl-gamma-aminobutyrate hydrolase family protein [Clostridia bacterium]
MIGITATLYDASCDYRVPRRYADSVEEAGGFPLLLPASNTPEETEGIMPLLDGLLIPGGPDVNPLLYGEEPRPALELTKTSNDLFEIHALKEARALHKPILCICRGMQVLNVAFGGTLYQDIPSQLPEALRHKQTPTDRADPTHSLEIEPGSWLSEAYGNTQIRVNSFHHQAIKQVAPGFSVSAKARDGIIEAIEIRGEHILGVQWHPEVMIPVHPEHLGLFRQLVEASRRLSVAGK